MSYLNDIFKVQDKLNECELVFKEDNKKNIPENGYTVSAVFYTDGGCKSPTVSAWGVHGYVYSSIPTNSNSKCKSAVPTVDGYKTSAKENKANVISYIDYSGWISNNSTNNVCELTAMLKLFNLLDVLQIKDILVLADSMYVLTLLTDYQKYINNGFTNSQGKPLSNLELVKELINSYTNVKDKFNITLKHVKGHSGDFGNDRADSLCSSAMNRLNNVNNNVYVSSLDEVTTNREEHENESFVCATPSDYFDITHTVSKMFTEECLFTVTNAMIPLNAKRFFMGSFGEKLKSVKSDKKKQFRGKPFADVCTAVIELDSSPVLINALISTVNDKFTDTGVIEFKLNYQTRDVIYNDLLKGGWKDLLIEPDKQRIVASDKTIVAEIIKPPRLAFNLMKDYDKLSAMLTGIINNTSDDIQMVADITDKFYEISEKKGTVVYKTLANEEGVVQVETNFLVNGVAKSTELPINIGVDVPNKISLGRLKDLKPSIKLFVFDVSNRMLRYGTFIETVDGRGIWMGLYSNLHIH